jgi:hypothetical protein
VDRLTFQYACRRDTGSRRTAPVVVISINSFRHAQNPLFIFKHYRRKLRDANVIALYIGLEHDAICISELGGHQKDAIPNRYTSRMASETELNPVGSGAFAAIVDDGKVYDNALFR